MASTALDDVTVLDLTRVRAGPTCVRQLADWGAKVIKIEMPEEGGSSTQTDFSARHEADFQNLHRNKRGMTLNLKSPDGLEVLRRMVKQADVIVENYRPDVKTRLGIGYDALDAVNPRLIYASISGFGQDGPYQSRPGVDQIAQGMSGLMSITGEPGRGPMRVGTALADLSAGVFAAMGILVALHERERSGRGQWVQTSLLQAQIFMLDFQAARYLMAGEVAEQAGNNHPTGAPTGVFKTQDGHVNVAPTPVMWKRFCKAIKREDLIDHPDYATPKDRRNNRDRLNGVIGEITMTMTSKRAGGPAQRSRHSLWPDLHNRPDLRRSAGSPSSDRAECKFGGAGPDQSGRATGHAQPDAEQPGERRPGVRRTHRPDSGGVRLFCG